MQNGRRNKRALTLAALAGCVASASASAAQLGIYEFTGTSTGDNQLNAVTSQPTGATFSTFTRTNVLWTSAGNVFNSNNWTVGASVDTAEYVTFSITASAGYDVTLESLSFGSQRSSQGPASAEVRTSSTGSFDSGFTFTPPTSISTSTWDFDDFTIAAGTTQVFRFYGWSAISTGGTLRFDNVALNGAVTAVGGAPFVYFDTNGATAGVGGSGTWDTTSNNWSTVAAGDIATSTYIATVPVVFAGTAGSVTVDGGGVSVASSMSINSTGYTFSGGAISLASGASIVTDTGVTTTISSQLTGIALTKAGAGTLVLTGSNSQAGTNIFGGVLSVGSDASLGAAGAGITLGGGTLQVTEDLTATGRQLAGSGSIDIAATKTLTLDGTVSASTISLTNAGTLVLGGSTNSISSLTAAEAVTVSVTGGAMASSSINALSGSGTTTIDGAVSVSGSTLVVGAAAGGTLAITGDITGSSTNSTVAKTVGTGTLALSGTGSTFRTLRIGVAGTSPIDGGMVSFTNAGALGAGTSVAAGASIQMNSGTLHNAGSAATIQKLLSFGDGAAGGVTFSGSDMTFDSGSTTISTASFFHGNTVTTPVSITLDTNVTLETGISGGTSIAGMKLLGSGTLTVNGTSSYIVPTTVSGATLAVNGSMTSTAATIALTSGGTLKGTGTIAGSVTATSGTVSAGNSIGVLTVGGVDLQSGTLHVELDSSGSGDTLIVTGTALLEGATLTGTATGEFTNGQIFTIVDGVSGSTSGAFAGLAESASVLLSGKEFTISYLADGGGDVTLTAVPEPASLSLLALGGLGLMKRRRRAIA